MATYHFFGLFFDPGKKIVFRIKPENIRDLLGFVSDVFVENVMDCALRNLKYS